MNTSYVQGQTAEGGEVKIAVLTGSGPTSYSQTTGDVIANPGSGDYIAVPFDCVTQSGRYFLTPQPTTVGQLRAGSASPGASGWSWHWFSNGVDPGTPLSLGPLSAAASTSAFTANGVLTVVGANTLVPGNFIVLSGGASNKSIFLNGQILQVISATSTQYVCNYGPAKALNYVSAADAGLKYQIVQASPTNYVQLGTGTNMVATVTGVGVASQVLTVTAANSFSPGQFVVIQGLVAGEVPQGLIAHILTANATTFTAACQGGNLGTTNSETGTATLLVTNGNIPIMAGEAAAITGTTVAATAASATAAGAITVLPVAQNYTPGQLTIVEGLTHGSTLNGQIYPVLAASLSGSNITANAYLTAAVTTGTADLGTLSLLVTGMPTTGIEVFPGTNLSAEVVQFGAFITQV